VKVGRSEGDRRASDGTKNLKSSTIYRGKNAVSVHQKRESVTRDLT
jgi:hypothetical protein